MIASAILSLSNMSMAAEQNQAKTTIGQRIDDAKIVTVVNADFVKDKELSSMRINVDSTQGNVVLKGTAPNASAKERAETIAKGVNGVVSVDNRLTVGDTMNNTNNSNTSTASTASTASTTTSNRDNHDNTTNSTSTAYNNTKNSVANTAHEVKHDAKNAANKAGQKLDDAAINAAINTQLAGDNDLSAVKINVDVKNGHVWLKGTAPSSTAKNRATDIAKSVDGVTKVHNQLTVSK